MKIRNGFVSNSSTSSFLIYGVCLEDTDAILKKLEKSFDIENEELNEEVNVREALDNVFQKTDIEVHSPYGSNYGLYIGTSWAEIKDNETGAQFKERIREGVKKVLGDLVLDKDFKTLEEAYAD